MLRRDYSALPTLTGRELLQCTDLDPIFNCWGWTGSICESDLVSLLRRDVVPIAVLVFGHERRRREFPPRRRPSPPPPIFARIGQRWRRERRRDLVPVARYDDNATFMAKSTRQKQTPACKLHVSALPHASCATWGSCANDVCSILSESNLTVVSHLWGCPRRVCHKRIAP